MQVTRTLIDRLRASSADDGGFVTGSFLGLFTAICLIGFIRSGALVSATEGTEVEQFALFLSDPQAAMAAFFEQITPTVPIQPQ